MTFYISWFFIATTILTIALLYKTIHKISPFVAQKVLTAIILWLIIQEFLAYTGFYLKTDSMPPRFGLAIIPPLITIIVLFSVEKSRRFLDKLPLRDLTLLHVCRIPVEIVLLWLYQEHQIPKIMTFEGQNFDILSGLTAVPIAYFVFKNGKINRPILLVWNIVCLLLVINIITMGILSAPTPLQKIAFEQPNIGVLKFPYIGLPSLIVPIVIFAHLVAIKQLSRR